MGVKFQSEFLFPKQRLLCPFLFKNKKEKYITLSRWENINAIQFWWILKVSTQKESRRALRFTVRRVCHWYHPQSLISTHVRHEHTCAYWMGSLAFALPEKQLSLILQLLAKRDQGRRWKSDSKPFQGCDFFSPKSWTLSHLMSEDSWNVAYFANFCLLWK